MDRLQAVMLPSYHRQLIMVDDCSGEEDPTGNGNFKIHKFHHPILIYTEDRSKVILQLMCHGERVSVFNVFRKQEKNWITSSMNTQSLALERYFIVSHIATYCSYLSIF